MISRHFIIVLLFFAFNVKIEAQVILEGRLFDAISGKPVPNASILLKGNQEGSASSADGSFKLQTSQKSGVLEISHVSYKKVEINFKAKNQDRIHFGTLLLEPEAHALGVVDILAFKAEEGKSPINVVSMSRREITQFNTGLSYPELMRNIPGVYASRLGGGIGDAAINIRGFKQENIALTLNGIPIGSVENGLVYWSNWDGLQEVTQSLQVQKGIGYSELVSNSLGGTINIITHAPENQEGGQLSYYTTDYGLHRTSLRINSGSLNNGWRISFAGSRTTGQGYVDATPVNAWSYFLFGEKTFNNKHRLVISMMGSPDRHGQRGTKLSLSEIKQKGITYNPDWGFYNGRQTLLMENFYHKPLLSVSHYWTLNEKTQLATSLYGSYGYGGGRWAENFSGPSVFAFRTPSGQIDWDALTLANTMHNQTYISPLGDTLRNFSLNARTLFLASHYWAGIISVYNYTYSEHLTLRTGIHARHFKSWLWEEIDDLMGGNFFIDNYAWAIEGAAQRSIIKTHGDKVRIDNGAIVDLAAAFAKAEYHKDKFSATLSAGFNQNLYQREDRYNYPSQPASQKISRPGGELKAGAVYRMNAQNSVFINMGYISRAPYHKFVFPNYNNNPAKDLKNENILSAETGIGGIVGDFKYKLSIYSINWYDKSLLSNEYLLIDNRTTTRAMVSGLGARHKGIEATLQYLFEPAEISLGFAISSGNWKWKNNVNARLFNNENQLIDTIKVFADGLYVGDAPQLQIGAFLEKKIPGGFTFYTNFMIYDRFYADFDPATRTQPNSPQPYRIPGFSLWDVRLGYQTLALGKHAEVSLACNNLFNKEHIVRGDDGVDHDEDSFRGYWGPGRSFHLTFRLSL